MTDEEAMEELLNSDGYSFPTWTLTLGLPTYEMRDVMSLIASDKRPIPDDAAFISGYLHMDGAVVESSVKELLDRRLVYRRGSYLTRKTSVNTSTEKMRLHVAAGIFHITNIGTQKWRGRENLLVMINRHEPVRRTRLCIIRFLRFFPMSAAATEAR